jgi:hypothetical protein
LCTLVPTDGQRPECRGNGITDPDVPPPRATHPLEYTQLEREARDGGVLLVI